MFYKSCRPPPETTDRAKCIYYIRTNKQTHTKIDPIGGNRDKAVERWTPKWLRYARVGDGDDGRGTMQQLKTTKDG